MILMFIERKKKRSKYLVKRPGARKNLSVIESRTSYLLTSCPGQDK